MFSGYATWIRIACAAYRIQSRSCWWPVWWQSQLFSAETTHESAATREKIYDARLNWWKHSEKIPI